jgi:hypothetical protein
MRSIWEVSSCSPETELECRALLFRFGEYLSPSTVPRKSTTPTTLLLMLPRR